MLGESCYTLLINAAPGDAMFKREMIGQVVSYRVNGETAFWGIAEYMMDGWVGIRSVGGGLDEAPASMVFPDPT